MAADDYGLNYGLKPSDRLESVAKLRRRQKRQEAASAAANKTLDKLMSHPNLAAQRSLLAVSSALHPDNPAYADTLEKLNEVIATTPGTMPDSAAAMVLNGIDPNTKLGASLSSVQASADLQAGYEKLRTQLLARQTAEQQAELDRAAENTGVMGYVKSFSQVAFNAMDFSHQVEMNVLRQVINTDDGSPNPVTSLLTAGFNADTYKNTDLGLNISGGSEYATTGELSPEMLDMGDGYVPEPESPVLKLKKAWDQQMLGTAGRDMRTIETEQENGTIKKEVVDDSPASPGQWVASDVFDLDVQTRPYQLMSGLLDAGSYALDPSMYLTAGGVTKAFATAENKLLRGSQPVVGHKLSAMEQGAHKIAADDALDALSTAEAQQAAVAEKLAENERLLGAATSPEVQAEAAAAARDGARRSLTPATKEAAQAGAEESFARQAHLVLGEQEPALTKAAAEAEDAARLEHQRLYTPVEGVPAQAVDAPQAVPEAATPMDMSQARTGTPFTLAGYRGAGRSRDEVYNGSQIPFAGEADYVAPSRDIASEYGDQISEELVTLNNPLVLRTDKDWQAVREQLPDGTPDVYLSDEANAAAAQGIRDWATSNGYDGIVVNMSTYRDEAKSLRHGFGHDQVISYKPKGETPAAAVAPRQPSRALPKGLAGAKPRYRSSTLEFADDVDKALYIIAGKKASRSEGQYIDWLKGHFPGESVEQLKGRGAAIRSGVKQLDDGSGHITVPHLTKEQSGAAAPTAAPSPASRSVVVVKTPAMGKYEVTHVSGAVIAVVDDGVEAQRLADELSRMPGYGKDRTLEQVESWDYVTKRGDTLNAAAEFRAANREADANAVDPEVAAKSEPDTVPGGSAGAGRSVDELLEQRDSHKTKLEELREAREQLLREAENAQKNYDRAEANAKTQATLIHEQIRASKFAGDPTDNTDPMQFLREVSGLKAGGNALDVDKALGFITNNYNGAWNKLMDAMVEITNPALLDEVTHGKLGAEAINDIAGAASKDELRAVLAKHLARPDSLSPNMGRLRGVRVAAQVRHGKSLETVVSQYGKWFGHAALASVIYGKQLKRSAVPWAHARHIDDHDGVVETAYDQITYALNLNHPVSTKRGQGATGSGGMGRRATPGTEPLLDDAGQPVLDSVGAPVMMDVWEDVPYESALEFRRKWMNRFIKAKPGQQLRTLWNELHTELVDRAADIHELPSALRAQFKEELRLSRMDARDYTRYNTETRAAERRRQILIDGQVVADDLVSKEAQISDYLIAPDWQEMRRAMSSVKEVLDKGGNVPRDMLHAVTGTVFERYWRTSVIAFRGAYLIRNMADIQLRMLLNGSPNLATNPQAVLGLSFSHLAAPDGRIGAAFNGLNHAVGKALDKAKVADRTLLDKDFYEKAEPELAAYLQEIVGKEVFGSTPFQDLASRGNASWADPGQGAAPRPRRETVAYEEIQAPIAGSRAAAAASFWEGWGFSLDMLRTSPMAAMALDVINGKVPSFLKSRAGAGLADPKGALVDWLVTDKEGRKILDRAMDGSPGIRAEVGDVDVNNGEGLSRYLFGEQDASIASQWGRLTLGLDPALVKAVSRPKAVGEDAVATRRKEMQGLIRDTAAKQGYIKDGVIAADKQLPVAAVPRDIVVERKNGVVEHFDRLVDFFFSASGKFEHAAGYLPEFRFNKWRQAAQLVGVLSPEDAAKLVETATKALGGAHLPNSWAGRTLRELKRNAKNAKGSGAFTLDDLDHATDVQAAKHVKELFYDARNRNQVANSLRLISPFAQPWANTLIEWTKLGLANPGKVYAAGVVFTAAQGRDSNWLQDDPMSPNDAFFYRDPKSRQLTVGVPGMGPLMAVIGNLNPATMHHNLTADAPVNIDPSLLGGGIQLQSMNLALQDGLLPGSGPLVTLGAAILEQTGWYRSSMPDVFKDFMMPFVSADPDADPTIMSVLVPAWAQGILGAIGIRDWAPKIEKYLPAATQALAQQNPDNRYFSLNAQGDIQQSDAQRAALLTDAEHYAGSMLWGRAWVQNVAPGAPQVQQLMVADDGRIMATAKLYQEYMSELRMSGDRTQALTAMVDRYGAEALFAMLPTRGSTITPTNAAYEFLKANPDMAEDIAPIVGLMAPEGGYSARMDRYMRQRGGNPALSSDETMKYVNAYAKDAAQGRIDRRYNAGELTKEEYEAESSGLTQSYRDAGADMPDYGNWGEDQASYRAALVGSPDGTFKGALANPEFNAAFPNVAPALAQYEKYRTYAIERSGKDTFTSNEMREWNEWLWKKQGELISQYPSSRVAFTKIYMPELEAK